MLDQGDARCDEQRAQNDRSRNSPEQRGVLPLLADAEALEEDEEDEEIVDAERRLNRIAGHEFERALPALSEVDPDGEDDCRSDEHRSPDPCDCLCARRFATASRQEGVHQKQCQHCAVEAQPPSPGSAGNHCLNATGAVAKGRERRPGVDVPLPAILWMESIHSKMADWQAHLQSILVNGFSRRVVSSMDLRLKFCTLMYGD